MRGLRSHSMNAKQVSSRNLFHVILALILSATFSMAALEKSEKQTSPVFTGKPSGNILATGSRRVILLNPEGEVLWQHKGQNVSDCWMLQNGHVLFADNQVTEVDPASGKVVFSYQPKVKKGGGVFGCQPLKNGNILVGENSTGKILELSRDGKIAFELQLPLYQAGNHQNLRMVRKLSNGNYLVCHSGKHIVREYTADGKVVFEVKVGNIAFSAIRLKNGNTLVGHIDQISEFDPQGKLVWQFSNTDIPGLKINSMCGIHIQTNGNIAVGVYSAYKKGGQVGLFEITRDKTLIWKYSHPKSDGSMMSLQMLDSQSRPLPGHPLR